MKKEYQYRVPLLFYVKNCWNECIKLGYCYIESSDIINIMVINIFNYKKIKGD